MGIHLADQTVTFLYALLTGALLGVFYDAFRVSRIAIPTAATVVFVEDIIYFLVCAVITFVLMMSALDGKVRFFLFVGEMIGAVLYFLTIGQLVIKVSKTIIGAIKAILRFIFRWLLLPIWRLLYWIVSLIVRPIYFLAGIIKKSGQRLKFRLKVGRIVLYNHCKDYLRKKIGPKKDIGERNAEDAQK